MPRLIDADALVQMPWVLPNRMTRETALECFRNIVSEAPTIDAEPVRHGQWSWREDWGHSSISEPPELLDAYWICSACGTDLLQYLKSHFPDIPTYTECSEEVPTLERCPYCGAKMDAKEK